MRECEKDGEKWRAEQKKMKCNYLLIADKFLNATSCVCKLLQKPTKILAFSTGLFIQYTLMLKPILAHCYLLTKSADKYNRQINMQIYVRQIRLTGANAIRMLAFCSLSSQSTHCDGAIVYTCIRYAYIFDIAYD